MNEKKKGVDRRIKKQTTASHAFTLNHTDQQLPTTPTIISKYLFSLRTSYGELSNVHTILLNPVGTCARAARNLPCVGCPYKCSSCNDLAEGSINPSTAERIPGKQHTHIHTRSESSTHRNLQSVATPETHSWTPNFHVMFLAWRTAGTGERNVPKVLSTKLKVVNRNRSDTPINRLL